LLEKIDERNGCKMALRKHLHTKIAKILSAVSTNEDEVQRFN
jgi:hypothetical protein